MSNVSLVPWNLCLVVPAAPVLSVCTCPVYALTCSLLSFVNKVNKGKLKVIVHFSSDAVALFLIKQPTLIVHIYKTSATVVRSCTAIHPKASD